MALVSTEAIVLKSIDFGESHKIVNFFTLEFGKLKAVVKGAHSLKNKFGVSLEPITHTRIVFYDRPSKDLQLLSQSDLIQAFSQIRRDFTKTCWSFYLLELTDELTLERDKSKPIFFLLKNTFERLENCSSYKLLIKYFELKLFQISGYALQLKNCVFCGKSFIDQGTNFFINIYKGGISCEVCSRNKNELMTNITGETLKILSIITSMEISKIERLVISDKTLEELDIIAELYRNKYINKELKSLKFIKNVDI